MTTPVITAPHSKTPVLIGEIEILRAIAVFLVMLHHGGAIFAQPLALGLLVQTGGLASGVDLFFVVSGYVIARGLLPALIPWPAAPGAVLRRFWLRRAFRLWPAAYLWALICLGLAAICARLDLPPAFGSVHSNAQALAAAVLHYANFRFFLHWGDGFYGATFQYWSLAAEEQFYAAFPLLLLLCGRFFVLPVALLALLSLLPITACLRAAGLPDAASLWQLLFGSFRYATPFFGVLLAWWQRRGGGLPWLSPRRHGAALALAALLMLGATIGLGADRFADGPGHSWSGLAALGLVTLAAQDRGLLMAKSALPPALLWAGSRSYALYLTHVPVWLGVHAFCVASYGGLDLRLPAMARAGAILTAFAASALLAEALHRLVERPARAAGRRLARSV